MELLLKPHIKTDNSTISDLFVNDKFECYILEDVDRGLKSSMTLEEINAKKIYGRKAIPEGKYEIIFNYSNRFKKVMPLLINVPGFEGIRIHPGNYPVNTLGCLLPGIALKIDTVLQSKIAYNNLILKLKKVHKNEKIFITINR